MTQIQTVIRTGLDINGRGYFLAGGQDVEVKRDIENAVQAGGRFVHFVPVGGGAVSVLINKGSRVVLTVETVELDSEETADGPLAEVIPLDFG